MSIFDRRQDRNAISFLHAATIGVLLLTVLLSFDSLVPSVKALETNLGFGNTGNNNIGIGLTGDKQVGFGSLNSGTGNIGFFNSGTSNIGIANSGSNNIGFFNSGSSNIGLGALVTGGNGGWLFGNGGSGGEGGSGALP
ncbi:hypothetical protein YTPLAS21_17480 [Candidatus Nitrosocosmicus sp.]|nr:hypothetical protein YTPLAS21_17480 [Candidatus Nitrosocosmicus sp.]